MQEEKTMETPKCYSTTLQQLMQQEESVKSSSRSIDMFPISIVNYERRSRSIRINPLEYDEIDFKDYNEEGNTTTINNSINTRLNSNNSKVIIESERKEVPKNPAAEAWLPITESRNGNLYYCIFHLVSSGLGFQSLLLPLAFTTLGWAWGITWLSIAFIWQLYTMWLLTQLHESSSGFRYSRYLQLSMAAFGPKLGKLLALLPVMYLSGGTCVTLLITGGGTMQQLYHILCEDDQICHAKSLTTVEWYLVFIFLAIVIAQLPNLNSVAWVSLVSAISAVVYCTVIWIMSIRDSRPSGTKHSLSGMGLESEMKSVVNVFSALGIVAFSFRGHNLVLEIQGTLPPSSKDPTHKIMWKGVKISYALIAMCLFPLAIGGYWTFGNLMPNTGMLKAFAQFHGNHHNSKLKLAIIYFFLIINSLCSFQIYAMPVFDNFELRYVTIRKKPCTWWLRSGLRTFFGGLVFFIAVALPILPLLGPLIGGIALPVSFAYPCFMWISIKKPSRFSTMWFLNIVLGTSGILLSVLLIISALYNLVIKGLPTNFFHPKLS